MSPDPEYSSQTENKAVRKLVLYVLLIVFVSAILLAINTGMIYSLAQGVSQQLPDLPMIPQIAQLFIFVGPVTLLYLEWYVWDVISARRVRSRAR
jgi:hypothetical protein